MNYKIKSNENEMREVFNKLKGESIVTDFYFGKSVMSLYVKELGLAYIPGRHSVSTILSKRSKLVKKFHELTKDKKIILEETN